MAAEYGMGFAELYTQRSFEYTQIQSNSRSAKYYRILEVDCMTQKPLRRFYDSPERPPRCDCPPAYARQSFMYCSIFETSCTLFEPAGILYSNSAIAGIGH